MSQAMQPNLTLRDSNRPYMRMHVFFLRHRLCKIRLVIQENTDSNQNNDFM